MSSIANDIHAEARTLSELLNGKKYQVDYFQREYRWETEQIEQLLTDLESAFFSNYQQGHTIQSVPSYNCYYMGPIVICDKKTSKSIVDGQQRLTSMTLLLIHLNNLQKDDQDPEDLTPLIFSKRHGKKSYNIEVPDRTPILDAIFNDRDFNTEQETDESVQNMFDRYLDIKRIFPEELKENLSLFIDWVKEKIVFVEIVAYSDENAYTIFETMNDRGLNLTATEMLKSFILSNVRDSDRVTELNELWKKLIAKLHKYSQIEDLEFIKAWLRSAYAESIRSSTRGAENEDFEKIGTRFHTWVRDNLKRIGLKDSDSFYYFIKGDFVIYNAIYCRIKEAQSTWQESLKTLYLSSNWNIASSLSLPLFLSPITKLDDERTVIDKINIVAKFLDIYAVKRTLQRKSITQNSIRYFIYTLIKEVRGKELYELRDILREKVVSQNLGDIPSSSTYTYLYDRKFLRYLFARITFHLEQRYGNQEISFDDLMAKRRRSRYGLFDLISYDYIGENMPEIPENERFGIYSMLGNIILIPHLLGQEYEKEIKFEQLSLLENTNILSSSVVKRINEIQFEPLNDFSYGEIQRRQEFIFSLINEIWSSDSLI